MSVKVKEWIKLNLPGAVAAYRSLRYGQTTALGAQSFGRGEDIKGVFTRIFRDNVWMDPQSVSGEGSNLEQTRVLRAELPRLLRNMNARTMLDAPCGDFNWLKETELGVEQYIGVDIVTDLVTENQRRYGGEKRRFIQSDLTRDALPKVDLILCRDCLVHLSFADIRAALENFKASGSTYLLTTTFPTRCENRDIPTGDWRPLNLRLPPFNFPEPRELLNEECTTGEGAWADKSLGLWRLADIEPR